VAPGKKNASTLRASLVFLDESGLLMAPLVRRSWAPRGRTPILYQTTRSREKVSIIAALSVSPQRRRVGLYFSLYPNANVTMAAVVAFLRELARHLQHAIILIWDRLPAHRGRTIRRFLARRKRCRAVFLPPYAPELNPVERLWSYLKTNPLANLAAPDAEPLSRLAHRQARKVQQRQALLRSFIRSTPLAVRLY
jgi:transposase